MRIGGRRSATGRLPRSARPESSSDQCRSGWCYGEHSTGSNAGSPTGILTDANFPSPSCSAEVIKQGWLGLS